MKVIIAGSRTFDNYSLLEEKCNYLLKNSQVTEIISGGQVSIRKKDNHHYGADYFGEVYAFNNNIRVRTFMADWNQHGRRAGPIRNDEMGQYADVAIIFWNGFSKGSKDMIEVMKRLKKPIRIIRF